MDTLYLVTEDGKEVDIKIPADSETLYREIREKSGAGSEAAVSLEGPSGRKLHITPRIARNTPLTRYMVRVHRSKGMLIDEVNMDLVCLENRISELEKQLSGQCPPAIEDLKQDVKSFRHKLETTKHLSWLNCYKELPPSCRRLQYRRRSDAKQKVVREQFLQICEQHISEEVRQCLRLSSFDSMLWSDEEILLLLQFMFTDLGLIESIPLDMEILRNFLFQVYKNYNEVPFHNFRHCFCVAQMMYAMVCKADLVKRIGDMEVLILLVSCICHDLDHPGYNNIYQINARTELALRYNDISPLENHHCSIAFRILELDESNIFKNMDKDTYKHVREGIIRCILATDMARHNEILSQFKDAMISGFDFNNRTHINLLCMVLIKVADISNEARPMDVAEPWLDRLLQEFFTQSDAEKEEGLPVTPFMDREKITKPSSQCSFIGFVLLPLFEALCDLLTELSAMMVDPVKSALEHYRRLNEAHHKGSLAGDLGPPSPTKHVLKSQSSYSIRKPSISFSQHPDLDEEEEGAGLEDISTDEEETVTEVAVSEKTLKFKISTESTSSGRKSDPGSRKGSRERGPASLTDEECPCRKERSMSEAARSPGLVRRLRTLGERLRSASESPKCAPPSPASLKCPSAPPPQTERRASTLPKVNRKRFASEARKGWRGLLKKREEGAGKSNGLSQDPVVGDSEDSGVNNNRKKNRTVEGSPQRQHWVQNLVSSLRGKKS
ncbi:high affinity cGMP-specific 3',5'-cyclic phosphodiesterase 9A isoform X2 [Halyomorpha halys]|uniref:high affinity cGMP-specific 3',5'-cyclic phosphodiesterase 9A isoform X2 n=1 Tax=Halyomorpha halys TaxID=286706 RepID=UPI0006D515B2